MNKILYTVNLGGYDKTPSIRPDVLRDGWRALYFTDRPETLPAGWELGRIPWDDLPACIGQAEPVMAAKSFKILPWLCLGDDWERSAWIDANIKYRRPLEILSARHSQGFVTMAQPQLDSLYQELDKLVRNGKRPYMADQKASYREQLEYYEATETPDRDGHACRTCVIFRNNTNSVRTLCEDWYQEFWSWNNGRDQVALRKVLNDSGRTIRRIRRGRFPIAFRKHVWQEENPSWRDTTEVI